MDVIIKHYFDGSIKKYGERGFKEHNEMVKRVCREQGREVLVFQAGEGWGRLCSFLGKEMPDREFPHVNERGNWRQSFGLGWSWVSLYGFGSLLVFMLVGFCIHLGWFNDERF